MATSGGKRASRARCVILHLFKAKTINRRNWLTGSIVMERRCAGFGSPNGRREKPVNRFKRPGDDQPPLPKPYAFVPIPDAPMRPEPPTGHSDFKCDLLTGTIKGTLMALSPIHVASGAIELTGKLPSLA